MFEILTLGAAVAAIWLAIATRNRLALVEQQLKRLAERVVLQAPGTATVSPPVPDATPTPSAPQPSPLVTAAPAPEPVATSVPPVSPMPEPALALELQASVSPPPRETSFEESFGTRW